MKVQKFMSKNVVKNLAKNKAYGKCLQFVGLVAAGLGIGALVEGGKIIESNDTAARIGTAFDNGMREQGYELCEPEEMD